MSSVIEPLEEESVKRIEESGVLDLPVDEQLKLVHSALYRLEHQCYTLYVHLNTITKYLVDHGIANVEQLFKDMDELNLKLWEYIEETVQEPKKDEDNVTSE